MNLADLDLENAEALLKVLIKNNSEWKFWKKI